MTRRGRLAAVFARELAELSRGRALFALRTLYGGGVCLAMALEASGLLAHEQAIGPELMSLLTQGLFAQVAFFEAGVAVLLGALLGLVSVRDEMREKTLGLLVLSEVSPGEVVVGKTLALSSVLVLVLAAALPVFALLGWGGGMEYAWLAWLVVVSAALGALGIAVGIFSGLAFRGGAAAALVSVVLLAAILVVPFWLSSAPVPFGRGSVWYGGYGTHGYFGGSQAAPRLGFPAVLSPIAGLSIVSAQGLGFGSSPAWPLLSTGLLALAFVLGARGFLSRAAAMGPSPGLRARFQELDRLFERLNVGGVTFGERSASGPVRGNPVAWLARTTGGMGLPRYLVRCFVASAAVVLALVVAFVDDLARLRRDDTVHFLLGLAAVVLASVVGGGAVAGERQRRTLAALLATPLTGRSIFLGKVRASLLPLGVFVLPLLLLGPVVAEIVGDGRGETGTGSPHVLAACLAGYVVALVSSLRARTPLRAAVAGLAAGCLVLWLLPAGEDAVPAIQITASLAILLATVAAPRLDRAVGRST